MILKRCKYAFVFIFPVRITAKFCVMFVFNFILSSTFGSYSSVMLPLVICVQFLYNFFTLSFCISLVTTFSVFYFSLLLMTFSSFSSWLVWALAHFRISIHEPWTSTAIFPSLFLSSRQYSFLFLQLIMCVFEFY